MSTDYYIPNEERFQYVIQSIWQVNQLTSFSRENIIPKGVVEVIFNFSDGSPINAVIGDTSYQLPKSFISGFVTTPIQIRLPRQQVFFGIVFQPMAVRKIFKTPAGEFANLPIDLTLLHTNFNTLWHQLAEQDGFTKRVSIVLTWLRENIVDLQPQEQMINNFLYAVNLHDLSVNELANSICYSPRHLSRKIFEVTGMNAEEVLLYKKYLHAVHQIHHTDLPLTSIAYQSEFFDQSHFIRSFKSYAKMTPGEYRNSKSFIKGHIYEDVR